MKQENKLMKILYQIQIHKLIYTITINTIENTIKISTDTQISENSQDFYNVKANSNIF